MRTRGSGPARRARRKRDGRAPRVRRLLGGLRRAALREPRGPGPFSRGGRRPGRLFLGPRRGSHGGHRQGPAHRPGGPAVPRGPSPAGRPRGTGRLGGRLGRGRRRHRHGDRARPDGPSRRPRRAPGVPRRLRHPDRHGLPDERLRGVPADDRGAVRGPPLPFPERGRRPPEPRDLAAHRGGVGVRRTGRVRGHPPPAPEHGDAGLRRLRPVREGVRGHRTGRRAQGDLLRAVRRPGPLGGRPRQLHVLRRLRRGVPSRGDRLHPVAAARHDPGRRDRHRHGLRPRPRGARRPPRLPRRTGAHPDRVRARARRLGGAALARPAPGRGRRHGPVRRVTRPTAPAVLFAALLHDRPEARHPVATAVPDDAGHGLLPRAAHPRHRGRELVHGGAGGRRRIPAGLPAPGRARRRQTARRGGRGRGCWREAGAPARSRRFVDRVRAVRRH